MRHIKVAIVEDEEEQAKILESYLTKLTETTGIEFMVKKFNSSMAFLDSQELDYTIAFLDIGLPGLSGMQLAKEIRKVDDKVILVFVTALSQYAIEGYSVNASDYMLKPLSFSEFKLKMNRILSHLNLEENSKTIMLKNGNGLIKINFEDIIFCETSIHKIIYHTSKGDFEKYISMKETEKELNDPIFLRCNSCYIVNLLMVDSIKDSSVILKDGTSLAISRPRLSETIKRFSEFRK